MMERDDLLPDAVERFFAERGGADAEDAGIEAPFDEVLWAEIEELGFPLAGVPEAAGGTGGSWLDACTIAEAAGRHVVALPIVETGLLAGWLLAEAGLAVPAGPVTVGPPSVTDPLTLHRSGSDHVLSGRVRAVPWGARSSLALLARDEDGRPMVAVVASGRATVSAGTNLAGEPRDDLRFDDISVAGADVAAAPAWLDERALAARGALARAVQTLGALERARDLTISYAQDREQFGRAIARFGQVQDHLAQIARDVALARSTVELALEALAASGPPPLLQVAVARVMSARAATAVARRAHQVHGAIGVTAEYPLHRVTRRLLSWRDEFGSEADWARQVGAIVTAPGQDPWDLVVSTRPVFGTR